MFGAPYIRDLTVMTLKTAAVSPRGKWVKRATGSIYSFSYQIIGKDYGSPSPCQLTRGHIYIFKIHFLVLTWLNTFGSGWDVK